MTQLTPAPVEKMDGRNLYYSFIAGARKVIENQIELNRINVFPVSDGDTGTNLAATIRSVIESLHPHRSYKITVDRIAEATLLNARGNSGIIFAQFFYGLATEVGDLATITVKEFAESIQRSVKHVYEAVANPVEGTMLTVIKEWADYIYRSWERFSDFNQMLTSSYAVLVQALQETKTRLKVLAANNVVDAGAKGFVLFIEGAIEFINRRNVRELISAKADAAPLTNIEEAIVEKPEFRFCTEAVIKNSSEDNATIRALLEKHGNSVVVAGSEKIRRIHVHTTDPAALFGELGKYGTITFQKADDMVRQSDTVFNRKSKIALVTDSTCDLPQEILDEYQVHMLPVNISFGENMYLDKVTIKPEQFYKLLDEHPEYPKSSQVNETSFVNLYSHLASHYDSVISVHLSDKLSGTYNSSLRAAKTISREFGKQISVVNSKNLSGALGLIVLRTAMAIRDGLAHDDIVAASEKWVNDAKVFVSVKTLKYLIRGGRLSATSGYIARMLNLTPIVSVDESGKAIIFGKAFSRRSNMEKIISHIRRNYGARKMWNYIILHANNSEAATWFHNKMEDLTGIKAVATVNISPVIGANAGVGAAAVAFLEE